MNLSAFSGFSSTAIPCTLMLLACGGETRDAAQELIGGVPVVSRSEFPGTVALNVNQCTATKIGAHHFLTAGHCIGATSNGAVILSPQYQPGRSVALTMGLNATTGQAETNTVTIRNTYMNPSYASYHFHTGGSLRDRSDVAVLEFVEATPSLEAIPLYLGQLSINQPVIMAGYGCEIAAPWLDDGVRRLKSGRNYVESIFSGSFELPATNAQGETVRGCTGDSGGAVFAETDAGPVIIGVNSFLTGGTTFGARLDDASPGRVATWLKTIVPDLVVASSLLGTGAVSSVVPPSIEQRASTLVAGFLVSIRNVAGIGNCSVQTDPPFDVTADGGFRFVLWYNGPNSSNSLLVRTNVFDHVSGEAMLQTFQEHVDFEATFQCF